MVPVIEPIDDPELVDAGIWPLYMTRIQGKTWLEYEDEWSDAQRVKCAKSLGRRFARYFCPGDSTEVVDSVIIPNIRKLRALERKDVRPFFPFIDKLIEDAPALKSLPLFLGHLDLNEMNVLVGERGEITGVVDWELSPSPQPFGIACYFIQFLAGEIIDRVFRERRASEDMDRGFWERLMEKAPESVRAGLHSNWEAVQTSVMIGTLFKVMAIEGIRSSLVKSRLRHCLCSCSIEYLR
jgi:hypothetical protein